MKTNYELPNFINLPNEDFKCKLSVEIDIAKNLILKRMQEVQNEYLKLGYKDSFIEYLLNRSELHENTDIDLEKLVYRYKTVNNNLNIYNYGIIIIEDIYKNNGMDIKISNLPPLIILGMDIFYLSLVNDVEVTNFLKSLKVDKIVTKFFESHHRLFSQLDSLSEKSDFRFPYSHIFIYYMSYSSEFFLSQLMVNFQLDLIKIFNHLKRKMRNNKLSNDEINILEYYKKLIRGLKVDDESFLIPASKNGLISDWLKKINYNYKALFHNLYIFLKEYNEDLITTDRSQSDFKVDFFDLAKILLRDKSILKDDLESQLKYGKPGNRRLKIKRVESLFLNLSDNYSRISDL